MRSILGIYLRPDMTQVVNVVYKNNKGVEVVSREEMIPCLEQLKGLKVEELGDFFCEIVSRFKIKTPDIYIALPDELLFIDCGEKKIDPDVNWNDQVNPWVGQLLKIDSEEFSISTPLVFKKKDTINITCAAIKKDYVKALIKAAQRAGVNLKAIGSSSFSSLRFINMFEAEQCFVEIWNRSCSITGYSPIKGMFKLGFPSFGWQDINNSPDGIEKFLQNIVLHDYSAFTTYGLANPDIPIYILSPKTEEITELLMLSNISSRIIKLPPSNLVSSKHLNKDQLLEYAVPIGMALYPFYQRRN